MFVDDKGIRYSDDKTILQWCPREFSGDFTIPNSVTKIGWRAFTGCSGLTSVTIPNSVTTIEEDAFSGCTGLTSITIPNSIAEIGEGTFAQCDNLKLVEIHSDKILNQQLLNIFGKNVKKFIFKKPISKIYVTDFMGCSVSIEIPDSVNEIEDQDVDGLACLTSIVVDCNNPIFDSRDNCDAIIKTQENVLVKGCKNTIIPNSVTTIGSGAFYGCSGLTSVTIPNSVTKIGSFAFTECLELNTIEIPDSVTEIGDYAFYGCSALQSIELPNSVTKIGERAFEKCIGLTSIKIPDSVVEIGNGAFEGCYRLLSLVIPSSVISIRENSFSTLFRLTSIVVDADNPIYDSREDCNAIIKTNENLLILGCKNTIIPNSVTEIGDYAFYDCTVLTDIKIPNSVKRIGNSAFSGCKNLMSIMIPDSVIEIGEDIFERCKSLTSIVVDPNNPIYDSREDCNAIIKTKENVLIAACENSYIPCDVIRPGDDDLDDSCDYYEDNDNYDNYKGKRTFERYNGSYVQDVEGWDDDMIDEVLDGEPDAYWNID